MLINYHIYIYCATFALFLTNVNNSVIYFFMIVNIIILQVLLIAKLVTHQDCKVKHKSTLEIILSFQSEREK